MKYFFADVPGNNDLIIAYYILIADWILLKNTAEVKVITPIYHSIRNST